MNDNTDARRVLPARAKAAAGGMEITDARLAALRAVAADRVTFDNDTARWLVDNQVMVMSDRRTYGELRRGGLIVEARGPGIVAVRLSRNGGIIVHEADAADAAAAASDENEECSE